MTVKYLQSRNGFLRYRRKVPGHLREYFGGRREIVQSLDLSDDQKAEAVRSIKYIDGQVSHLLAAAERAHLTKADPHTLAMAAEAWAMSNKFIGQDTAGLAAGPYERSDFDEWLEGILRAFPQREPELEDLEPLVRMKVETVKRGGRVPVELSIGRAAAEYGTHQQGGALKKAEETALNQLYGWIGANANFDRRTQRQPENLVMRKITRGLAREFIAHLHMGRGQVASTITRRVNSLKAIWTFAADHFDEPTISNPWSRQRPPVASIGVEADADKRLPFNQRHLELIEAKLRSNSIDPNSRGIIRLLKVTACRPLEIAGLAKADIFLEGATPWIWVRPNSIRGLKNKSSERRIPIVSEAVPSLRAIRDASDRPNGAIFDPPFTSTSGLSRRLGMVLRSAGIPKSTRLVPYSFRHSVAEALRVSGAPDHHAKAIMGHADPSMSGRYGAGSVDLEALLASLEGAIACLGEVPAHIYRVEELPSD
tara:strand:+ start:6243 stop:7688 length:1446 start_codon:yes stop_codon:yes gene_type:complete